MHKYLKYISGFVLGAFLFSPFAAYALSVYVVPQGGTGWGKFTSGTLLTGNGTSALSTTTPSYPIKISGGLLSLDFGTTTSNTWAGTQTFTNTISGSINGNANTATTLATPRAINGVNFDGSAAITITAASSTLLGDSSTFTGTDKFSSAPIFSSLTGLLKANGSSALTAAVNGTDYTLITALSCAAGNHFSGVTAAGVFTCSADTGTGGSGLATTSPLSAGNVLAYNASGAGFAYGVGTSTPALGSGLAYTGTLGSFVGGTSGTLSVSGLSTSNFTSANISQWTNDSGYLTSSGAVTSLKQSFGTGQVGAITLATSSAATSNGVTVGQTITNSAGTFTFTPTVSVSAIPNSALANSTISGVALGSNLNSLSHDSTLTGTSYNGSAAVSDWGLNLAHANTFTALQQFNGNASSSVFSTLGPLTVGTTSTTTIWGNATSSFSGGINLANGGCFAISGTCLSTGGGGSPGGSGTEVQFRSGASTFGAISPSAYSSGPNRLSFGTTTQQLGVITLGSSTEQQLTLSDDLAGDNNYYLRTIANSLFVGTSTTATSTFAALSINPNGKVGIGTTSATNDFEVVDANAAPAPSQARLYSSGSGGVGLQLRNARISNDFQFFVSNAGSFKISQDTIGDFLTILPGSGKVGIATSTPGPAQFQVASSTGPQFAISDGGATNAPYTFHTQGGNLYVATSSVANYSTSTNPILSITTGGFAGLVGVSTSSPAKTLSVGGDLIVGATTTGGTPGDLWVQHLGTAAGTFVAADPSGKLIATTSPSGGFQNLIGARVYNSTGESITGTFATSTFDSESFDTDTMHSTVSNTGRITFNTAGYYEVTANCGSLSNAVMSTKIVLNGGTLLSSTGAGNAGAGFTNGGVATTVYHFNVNDYIEQMCAGSAVTSSSGIGGINFSAFKVGN